ncbi:MAG: hypothetical protein JNM08_15080, partial [Rubrivivax sp.]|nr:hypothetical protein [Rubrivivax sp.]
MARHHKSFRVSPIAVAAVLALGTASVHPAAVNWINAAGGIWSTATNWSTNPLIPVNGDDVTINLPQTLTVTYNAGTVALNSLTLGSSTNTLAISGGTLGAGTLSSVGTITVTNGTLNVSGGSTGPMTVNSGGVVNNTGTLALTNFLRLTGGQLSGGTIQQSGANRLAFNTATNTLNNVTVRGDLTVADSNGSAGFVRVTGGLVVQTEAGASPGVVNISTTAASDNSTLAFAGTQTFDNATVNMGGANGFGGQRTGTIGLIGAAGSTLTFGPNTLIR